MAIFDMVNTEGLQIVYFDCVLSETISVMGRRLEAVGKRFLRAVDTCDYAVEFMGVPNMPHVNR